MRYWGWGALAIMAALIVGTFIYYRTSPYQKCMGDLSDQASPEEARSLCSDPATRNRLYS